LTPLAALPRHTVVRLDGRDWRIYGAHRGRVLLLSALGTREVDEATAVEVVRG
jgi:hypothetical protein